jgi:hypothetical protein
MIPSYENYALLERKGIYSYSVATLLSYCVSRKRLSRILSNGLHERMYTITAHQTAFPIKEIKNFFYACRRKIS